MARYEVRFIFGDTQYELLDRANGKNMLLPLYGSVDEETFEAAFMEILEAGFRCGEVQGRRPN